MSEWHFLDPGSRANLVAAWTREADGMLELASDPGRWEAPTGAGHWHVRDIVGHLVDTTEGYFASFAAARGEAEAAEPLGVHDMAGHVDRGAQAHRGTPQAEMLDRMREVRARMLGIVDGLSDDEWSGLLVPHKYMGPLPAAFYPLFQLVDYAVHSWDIRQGTGSSHGLDGGSADLLVPLAFILWQSTPEVPAGTAPYTVGISVTGRNAGTQRVTVSPEGVAVEPGDVEDLPAVIDFDAASLVLTAFGRINAGTVRGDRAVAERFLNSFFRI